MDTFWIQIFVVLEIIFGSNGQTLRSCYTCNGDACLSQLNGFIAQDCATSTDQCVTLYDGYTPIKRACYGALSTAEKTKCDTTNLECSKCDTDNCNYLGRTDHMCVTCSSVKDRTCLTAPTTHTATRCPAQLYTGSASCYIKTDGETTQRGCIITNLELNTCVSNATHACSTCSTSGCNTYEFPVGRRKCYRNGKLDYCDDANDNCYAHNIYGQKLQSCSSEVTNSTWNLCEKNPYRCVECLDNGCNTVNFNIKCRKCDSSTDKNCAGQPNKSTLDTCVDGCATYLKNEVGSLLRTTQRTCYENLPAEIKNQCQSGSGSCKSCLEDDCNSKIFPADRLLCYQCESATGCSETTLKPTACPFYSTNDKCVSVIKNGQPAEFACLSSFNRTKSCENTNSCVVSECSGNGCNNPALFEKSISCVQCNTTSNVECTTAPNIVGSMPCKQSMDTCYTMLQEGKVSRGCLADLNSAQQTYCRANCDLCNSEGGCNNKIFPPNRLFCHQCDSRVNATCSQATGDAVPTMCLNYDASNKCVALLTEGGTYIRTCASDQTAICANTVACSVCEKFGCNNAVIEIPTNPTVTPSVDPTVTPSVDPTVTPTVDPTVTPSVDPTVTPSVDPTVTPSVDPTDNPPVDTTTTAKPGGGGSVTLNVSAIMVIVLASLLLILNVNL